jgi:hypothetical protein
LGGGCIAAESKLDDVVLVPAMFSLAVDDDVVELLAAEPPMPLADGVLDVDAETAWSLGCAPEFE